MFHIIIYEFIRVIKKGVIYLKENMNRSSVYVHLNYLISLRDTRGRRQLIRNMTSGQTRAIAEIAKCITNASIQILRRDVRTFESKRLFLRTLASDSVTWARKKSLLLTHHTLLPVLLREVYVIQTIGYELQRTVRDSEQ